MKVLLVTPPMTQLNTPYPGTAYLTGFLRSKGIAVEQADFGIELVDRLFSKNGLLRIKAIVEKIPAKKRTDVLHFFLEAFEQYSAAIQPALTFLRGQDPSLAQRIASRNLLPEGPRFLALEAQDTDWAFGALGVQDRAKHLATLFVDDLSDIVREGVDEQFLFSRYGEKLAASQPSFDLLYRKLQSSQKPTLVSSILAEITDEVVERVQPDLIGLSVPFPGNVLGALQVAQSARRKKPNIRIAMGGGYPNTELRSLSDARVFEFVDYITLDDGERPLENILNYEAGVLKRADLVRTYVLDGGRVTFVDSKKFHDIPLKDSGTPTYDGLPLEKYISVLELLNPMHRLWSDARWNKATLAHGCYWKKCSFCDTSLDYIARYEPVAADLIIDRMVALKQETGQSGFHFVDEAAPPNVLRNVSQRLIERGETFSWWGNVRFDRAFTPELAQQMADAGCIAVSGGLEVASDRLLKLMQKGVSVEQVARVTRAFRDAGIMVHAYLMYGFPTQTEQETVDSLERVRQLFAEDCIQSAYWHRFSTTAHSAVGLNPRQFGIELLPMPTVTFARNDLDFSDPTGTDHDALGVGLRKALYNYMHGIGLDEDVRVWFEGLRVPKAKVKPDLVQNALINS